MIPFFPGQILWSGPIAYQIIKILSRSIANSHHEHCQFVFVIRLFLRRFESITRYTLIKEAITV